MMDKHQLHADEPTRFEALCAEIEEYDHISSPMIESDRQTHFITGQDHEAQLDAEILAGLVSP